MTRYNLELDKKQLELIMKSLDFYSRIQMGQVSELVNPFVLPLPDANYDDVEELIIELKKAMFPNLDTNSYYAIKSNHIPDSTRQMIDIMEVIRYNLNDKNGDRPYQWSNELDAPSITKIGEDNETAS